MNKLNESFVLVSVVLGGKGALFTDQVTAMLVYLAASTGNSNVNGDLFGTGEGGSDRLADCDSRASDNG